MSTWPIHAGISGPIVMVGCGSIGRGFIPLLQRHFAFDATRVVVVEPNASCREIVEGAGLRFVQAALTPENHRAVLQPLLSDGAGQGFCINLSVDTSSLALLRLCRELGVLYIDTVVEPWPGFYLDAKADSAARTNYALRETVRREKAANPGGTTAVSCCGANPGMVSWFVKQALLNLAAELGSDAAAPTSREGWAGLMRDLGVKGVHIAERDTQFATARRPYDAFWNTWSVEGFIAEGLQPAELGWGTHERWMPPNARTQAEGCGAAIFLEQPGADTRVRTWCPTRGAQFGLLVTHNEAISIADYYTVRDGDSVVFRPTCHYAYHPCDDAIMSLREMFARPGWIPSEQRVIEEHDVVEGIDELGVLLYGHARNAYWYGSQLSMAETRDLAPCQNATGLQVTSAVLAGMVWALENPAAGIVETDEMDHRRCLQIQQPYLGPVNGFYSDWTPLEGRAALFPEDIDTSDAWQFRNVLVRD